MQDQTKYYPFGSYFIRAESIGIFAFDTERAAILLVSGAKGGADQRRFYKKLIASADARFDGHLATLKTASASKQVKEKNHGKKSK